MDCPFKALTEPEALKALRISPRKQLQVFLFNPVGNNNNPVAHLFVYARENLSEKFKKSWSLENPGVSFFSVNGQSGK